MLLNCGVLVILVLFSFRSPSGAKKISEWWLKMAQKQGPNTCVVEEIPGVDLEIRTECRFWMNRKICGRQTRVRFECCEGFDRLDGEPGCTLVKPLKNILETANALGATEWVRYIREAGLYRELSSEGPFTLFAPTNMAFKKASVSMQEKLANYRGSSYNPIIDYHLITSRLSIDVMSGDQLVETKLNRHKIRINKYSNRMNTVNCAIVTHRDQEASNGVVHIIDGVLDPESGVPNNIVDILKNDGRFEIMTELMIRSGYMNILGTLSKSMTIFAPSDEAFQKLSTPRREKIMQNRETSLAILKNHVIPHVICESAITGEHKIKTDLNTKLMLDCSEDGTKIDHTEMTNNFILGRNGIIHMIDNVLLPDRAKTLVELAESLGLVTFVDLIRKSGLEETFIYTGDYTFFVPQESAWFEIFPEVSRRAHQDPKYAEMLIRSHGVNGKIQSKDIAYNEGMPSLDEDTLIRLQMWRKIIGVEDAIVIDSDKECENGVIHIVSKVIIPPFENLQRLLNSILSHTFYFFQKFLQKVKSERNHIFNSSDRRYYTYFVPTDKAFNNFGQAKLNALTSSSDGVTNLVLSHIIPHMLSKNVLEAGLTYIIEGFQSILKIKKNVDDSIEVNKIPIIESYITTDGIVHIIDDVLRSTDSNLKTYSEKTSTTTIFQRNNKPLPHRVNSDNGQSYRENEIEKFDKYVPSISQGTKNFSYVGHSYGNDIVGHEDDSSLYTIPSYRRSDLIQSSARPINFAPQKARMDAKRQGRIRTRKEDISVETEKNIPIQVYP